MSSFTVCCFLPPVCSGSGAFALCTAPPPPSVTTTLVHSLATCSVLIYPRVTLRGRRGFAGLWGPLPLGPWSGRRPLAFSGHQPHWGSWPLPGCCRGASPPPQGFLPTLLASRLPCAASHLSELCCHFLSAPVSSSTPVSWFITLFLY